MSSARRNAEVYGTGRHGSVAVAVDQDEAAGLRNFSKVVERKGNRGGDIANADLVERQRWTGSRCSVSMSTRCLTPVTLAETERTPILRSIFAARQQRLLTHPDQVRFELIGDLRPTIRRDQGVAPRHVDVAVKSRRRRTRPSSPGHVLRRRRRAGDLPLTPEGATCTGIASSQGAAGDDAGVEPAVAVGPQHVLHQHAQRRCRLVGFDIDRLQMAEQARSVIPGRVVPGEETLSPVSADNGIGTSEAKLSDLAKSRKPSTMRS